MVVADSGHDVAGARWAGIDRGSDAALEHAALVIKDLLVAVIGVCADRRRELLRSP